MTSANNSPNTTSTPIAAHRSSSITERILSTARHNIHQEENRLRTLMRVIEDVRRRQQQQQQQQQQNMHSGATTTSNVNATAAAAVGRNRQTGDSSRAAAGVRGEDAGRQRQRERERETRTGGRTRGYFMSGGRSISTNRRRRLR